MLETNLQCGEAFLGPPWQVNVDRGAHAGAQVGGAGVEVAVLLGDLEVFAGLVLNRLLHRIDSPGKSLKDALHISALLHGDDPQLILLVHPHEEGLLLVVVDAPALGPVPLHASGNQVLVS